MTLATPQNLGSGSGPSIEVLDVSIIAYLQWVNPETNVSKTEALGNSFDLTRTAGALPNIFVRFIWTETVRDFLGAHLNLTNLTQNLSLPFQPSRGTLEPETGVGSVFTLPIFPVLDQYGEIEISVPADAATTFEPPYISGPPERKSIIFVCDTRTEDFDFDRDGAIKPDVTISVPPLSQKNTTIPISFIWNVEVEDNEDDPGAFTNVDYTITAEDSAGGTIDNLLADPEPMLVSNPGSVSIYRADYEIPALVTEGKITITVSANSVSRKDSNVSGPEEARSKELSFYTRLDDVETRIWKPPNDTILLESEDVCNENYTFEELLDDTDYLSDAAVGGAFQGVFDIIKVGNYLYALVQIQRAGSATELSDISSADMALLEIDVSNNTCRVITTYADVLEAPIYLAEFEGRVYFYEGSLWTNRYRYFSLNGERSIADPPGDWRKHVGYLKSFKPGATVIKEGVYDGESGPSLADHGLVWRSELIHRANTQHLYENKMWGRFFGACSPLRVIDNALHFHAGFGNFGLVANQQIATSASPPQNPIMDYKNVQWLSYGKEINQRVTQLQTNDRTGWDILLELANITASYIGFEKDKFFFKPRYPYEGRLAANLGTNPENGPVLDSEGHNRSIPSSEGYSKGYFLIDNELMYFDGPTNEVFSIDDAGETQVPKAIRGAEQTEIQPHPKIGMDGSPTVVYYVSHVLNNQFVFSPVEDLNLQQDVNQLYNQVTFLYGENSDIEYYIENTESVKMNGGRHIEITVPLDRHQLPHVEWLAERYLALFGKVQYIADLTLKLSFYLNVGDVIMLRNITEDGRYNNIRFQILNVTHSAANSSTSLKIRTLPD